MSNLNYTSKHLFWMMFLLITLTPNITARAQDADVNKKARPYVAILFLARYAYRNECFLITP